jgi:hypothetical protein
MVDDLLARHRQHLDQFRHRHQRPARFGAAGPHLHLQELIDARQALRRQREAHRNFVLVVAAMHRRHVLAAESQTHHLDDVGLGHAQLRRLGLIDTQHQLGRLLVHRIVHADDVRRRLEGRPHLAGHGHLTGVIRPVHLGDDG